MLPWPTDRRHLAMMVRTFVDQLNDKIRSHHRDTPYPSDPDCPMSDVLLEDYLERLALDVQHDEQTGQDMNLGEETEDDVMESLTESLRELFEAASWNSDRRSHN